VIVLRSYRLSEDLAMLQPLLRRSSREMKIVWYTVESVTKAIKRYRA